MFACLPSSHQIPLTIFREDRPQVVGWPPLCTFRKNLSTTSTRPAYSQDLSKVEPCSEEEDHGNTGVSGQERPAMFVKVNLEGYAVGRKIDINAHHSYTSLCGALQSMFHGFLSGIFGLHCTAPSMHDQTPYCSCH
jgi:auxin-responsive protein IAA